jgi:acylphosphatase
MAAATFHVSGRVQGVGFRAATRTEALRLGIVGHARNLRDGRVEVLAFGDDTAINRLEAWLQHGPAAAKVDSVVRDAAMVEDEPKAFYTR